MAQAGEVDDEAVVADGMAGDVVAAAANRDRQIVLTRKADRDGDVLGAPAAGDCERTAVDQRVEGGPCLVVGAVALGDHLAREPA